MTHSAPDAKRSEYVTYEWAFALGAGKAVFTILLERTELHPRLDALQYVDFCKVHPWKKLFSELGSLTAEKMHDESSEQAHSTNQQADDTPAYILQAVAAFDSFDQAVRELAIETLANSTDPRAHEALGLAVNHSLRHVRMKASVAFASVTKAQDVRAVPGLVEAYKYGGNDPIYFWRAGLDYLIKMGTRAIPELLSCLSSEDELIRSGAAEILGLIEDPEAIPELVEALLIVGEDWDAFNQLTKAFEQMGRYAVLPLVEILPKVTTNLRRRIIGILGEIGDRAAVPGLINISGDPNRFVRADAIKALGKIKDESAVDALINLLSDREIVEQLDNYWPKGIRRTTRVCDVAADALRYIGTTIALAAVEVWQKEQEIDIDTD
ncbi:MAG TPA: HEAT repeat domain-containing protein [Aggregatilineaceae bacterium]|nr:HEAT repeat domain-containing protein [Aggregatilineaceae bacterium]